MKLGWFRTVLLGCLALVACGPADVAPTSVNARIEVPRPGLVDGVFLMIDPEITEGPVPERFSRELPASIAAFEATWPDYPAPHISRGLCAGEPEIIERFERAVSAAVAGGDDAAEVRAIYGDLLAWCNRPEQCAWAATAVQNRSGAADAAWVALAQCPGAAVESAFEHGSAPAETLIEYWAGRSWAEDYEPRWIPHLVTALEEVARAGDPWQTRTAAVLVSEFGEAAAETLLALYDDLPPGEARDQIASSFSELEHPRAKKLFAEYCQQAGDTDSVCQSDWSPFEGFAPAASEPDDDLSDCLSREELGAALAAGDVDAVYETADCLSELATTDRDQAVAQARTVLSLDVGSKGDASPSVGAELVELARWLDAFPEEDRLERELHDLGLLPRGPLPGTEKRQQGAGLHPGEVLAASGPVVCFDLETGRFPNQHDRLLYDFVELAGPPLDAAIFEEEAPAFEHPEGGWVVAGRTVDAPPPGVVEGMPYRLRAYLEGRIYQTDAQDYGDWYDLDRVLGLVNAMAEDQEAAVRVVPLPTGGQTACVLAAPRDAILAGIEAGLLQVGASGAAERGRELERQALEQLLEQGGP